MEKYPEGRGRESAVGALDGPREQAEQELRDIISECADWPTDEAAELAAEAEDLLREVTGETAELAIAESVANGGERVLLEDPMLWTGEDILGRASKCEARWDGLMAKGWEDGWPWCVVLKFDAATAREMAKTWRPASCVVAAQERVDRAARQTVNDAIRESQATGEPVEVRPRNPQERASMERLLAECAQSWRVSLADE